MHRRLSRPTTSSPFKSPFKRTVAFNIAVALALTACGSSDSSVGSADTLTAGAGSPATEAPASASAADTSDTARPSSTGSQTTSAVPEQLQFSAPLVGGGELDAATLATGQPVLLWFWAPF